MRAALGRLTLIMFLVGAASCRDIPIPGVLEDSGGGPPNDAAVAVDLSVQVDITAVQCAGLDEATCKARPGCVTDYCQGCGCNYSFAGCRAPSDKAAVCPGLGCLQGFCCRS